MSGLSEVSHEWNNVNREWEAFSNTALIKVGILPDSHQFKDMRKAFYAGALVGVGLAVRYQDSTLDYLSKCIDECDKVINDPTQNG